MANKKISQLNSIGPVGISTSDLLPIASGTAGSYQTAKVTAEELTNFVLDGMYPSTIGFTGSNKIIFDKSNWGTAGNQSADFPYLQVRKSDGLLVTGSGIVVPSVTDNMGDCVATTDLNLDDNIIINANDFYFGGGNSSNTRITYEADPGDNKHLKVQAQSSLTLSGGRHIKIDARALDIADTPISGNATITGGNLEIDPGNKLIVNEISGSKAGSDDASLTIEGSMRHVPVVASATLSWADSNIQYASSSAGPLTYNFVDVGDGQTMTMYVENIGSSSLGVKFTSGTYGPGASGAVVWGGEYPLGAPSVEVSYANLYTFVRINTGIFASAVTGYVY